MILRFLEHALFTFKTVSIYSAILILQFKTGFFYIDTFDSGFRIPKHLLYLFQLSLTSPNCDPQIFK